MARLQHCPCGSKLFPHADHDARGIFLCYTCDKCHAAQMAKYRPDVLTDSNYWADEDIDGDDGYDGDNDLLHEDGYPGEDQSEGDLDCERDA